MLIKKALRGFYLIELQQLSQVIRDRDEHRIRSTPHGRRALGNLCNGPFLPW
jgi:hypothetical protein